MKNIHATAISYKRKGVLILGKSGSGKSDLALRMIMQKDAKLVADDRVDIDSVYASAPQNLKGLLEVRGLCIQKFPFIKKQKIDLVVDLSDKIERLPEPCFWECEGIKIKKIKLNPFELSSLEKLILALKGNPHEENT